MSTRSKDDMRRTERETQALRTEIARIPWRTAKQTAVASGGNVIAIAIVDEDVDDDDATFTVSEAVMYQVSGQSLGELEVINHTIGHAAGIASQSGAFADEQLIYIEYDNAEQAWYLARGGAWFSLLSDLDATATLEFQGSSFKRINATGRYLFDGNKHSTDSNRNVTHSSDSPEFLVATAQTQAPTDLSQFAVIYRTPCGPEYETLTISDEFGILPTLQDGDPCIFQLITDGANWSWLPFRPGTGGFTPFIFFGLLEDKGYGDTAKLAKLVLPDRSALTGDEFYVIDSTRLAGDTKGDFWGRAATGGDREYRGWAKYLTADYNSTGLPGFEIVTMEGPAQWLIVTLNGDYSSSPRTCTVVDEQIRGRPFRGQRYPKTGDVSVYDDLSVATGAKSGEKWLIAWEEKDERYVFVYSFTTQKLLRAMITGTVPATTAIDGSAKTQTPGVSSSAVADVQKYGANAPPALTADTAYPSMKAINSTFTDIIGSTSEPIAYWGVLVYFSVSGTPTPYFDCIGPHDNRSLTNFTLGSTQPIYHAASSRNYRQDGEPC